MLALVLFLFLAFPRFQFVEKRDESDDYSYHADKQCDEVIEKPGIFRGFRKFINKGTNTTKSIFDVSDEEKF